MALKVKLRQKSIKGGRLSLFLDIYPPIINDKTGKSKRWEFLKKYISPPISYKKKKTKTGIEKVAVYTAEDSDILRIAEKIRVDRENELRKPEIYSKFELEQIHKKELGEKNFVEYFKTLAEKRTGMNHDNWRAASNYLSNFTSGLKRFIDIDEKFCEDFKTYLRTIKSIKSKKANLAINSSASYYNKYKAALRQAYIDGLLSTDINARIKPIKQEDPKKNFLTEEELNNLIKADCSNPLLKKVAIFSAMTGLRFSDVSNLTWRGVNKNKELGPHLIFVQKKTKGSEVLPISDQAFRMLGPKGNPEEKVFDGLEYSMCVGKDFYLWLYNAQITKKITWHCLRHSYACLLISGHVDLFTVSKMMGHKSISATLQYVKLLDTAKRIAADTIHLEM